jgi:hypothetical protein
MTCLLQKQPWQNTLNYYMAWTINQIQRATQQYVYLLWNGLILVKEAGKTGFSEEQPCQPKENPVLPDSFTQIDILILIGFRIGPPKIHKLFRIGLPKIHRRFRIGPPKIHRLFRIGLPQVTLNLLLPEFHSR